MSGDTAISIGSMSVVFNHVVQSECTTLEDIAKDPNRILPTGRPIISELILNDSATREALEYIINNGASVGTRDSLGNLPLFYAVLYGRDAFFDVLMAHGGREWVNRLHEERSDHTSLLHIAASNGRYGIAQKLIAAGAQVNAQDRYGETPLVDAIRKMDPEMAVLLIEAGADVEKYERTKQCSLLTLATNAALRVRQQDIVEKMKKIWVDAGAVVATPAPAPKPHGASV